MLRIITGALTAALILGGLTAGVNVANPTTTAPTTAGIAEENITISAKTSRNSRQGVRTDTRKRTRQYSGGSGSF